MKARNTNIETPHNALEMTVAKQGMDKYLLRLYITGSTIRSVLALTNLKRICEEYLEGRYELEVIDLYQHPALAKGEQIIAAPTLIKQLPLPFRRIIGDMSDKEKVLLGLDLKDMMSKKVVSKL
jgi:circadian clock protein KaiB